MKRTFPLFITGVSGFLLIIAYFFPYTESWSEDVTIWFDIMASMAYILGGGNLLKSHLMKIQSQKPGWGYSMITVAAFLVTLFVGMFKVGVRPATESEYYGESLVKLNYAQFPITTTVPGVMPRYHDSFPAAFHDVLMPGESGQVVFKGWLSEDDYKKLASADFRQEWLDTLKALKDKAQPPPSLAGRILFDGYRSNLRFKGPMSEEDKAVLLSLGSTAPWQAAVNELHAISNREHAVDSPAPPTPIPAELANVVHAGGKLTVRGPLSDDQRTALLELGDNDAAWTLAVTKLFNDAHQVKYGWSGAYNAYESAFWYLYEYAFRPLTSTMFSVLAFYVSSAAFRAFRAKNFEAVLLLGTAFLILLGRTYAGALLTSWLGPEYYHFTTPAIAQMIMDVFNTAGNRGIVIGIALGIVSTSLKIILGIDRSYLGSDKE